MIHMVWPLQKVTLQYGTPSAFDYGNWIWVVLTASKTACRLASLLIQPRISRITPAATQNGPIRKKSPWGRLDDTPIRIHPPANSKEPKTGQVSIKSILYKWLPLGCRSVTTQRPLKWCRSVISRQWNVNTARAISLPLSGRRPLKWRFYFLFHWVSSWSRSSSVWRESGLSLVTACSQPEMKTLRRVHAPPQEYRWVKGAPSDSIIWSGH